MIFVIVFNLVFQVNFILNVNENFNYEKLNQFGLGKRMFYRHVNLNNGYAHPEELPTQRTAPYIRSPYKDVYQGMKNKRDRRVYHKRFHYPAQPSGHKLICKGVFDCTLTHVAVETNGSIPIIFRGGVGYKHFTVIIKAGAGDELTGRVSAYCANILNDNEPKKLF